MLKLRDDLDFEILGEYGFKRDSMGYCYNLRLEDYTIFIWKYDNDTYYRSRYLYIELTQWTNLIYKGLDVLYKMVMDGVLING